MHNNFKIASGNSLVFTFPFINETFIKAIKNYARADTKFFWSIFLSFALLAKYFVHYCGLSSRTSTGSFNPFLTNVPILCLLKTKKPRSYSDFFNVSNIATLAKYGWLSKCCEDLWWLSQKIFFRHCKKSERT